MGSVILWEGGGRFVSEEEVADATLSDGCSFTSVQWTDRVDYLSGGSAVIAFSQEWVERQVMYFDDYPTFCTTKDQWFGANNYPRKLSQAYFADPGEVWRAQIVTEGTAQVRATSGSYGAGTGWRFTAADNSSNGCAYADGYNSALFLTNAEGNRAGVFYYKTTGASYKDYVRVQMLSESVSVTTDTGGPVQRFGQPSPVVTSQAGRFVIITFADGSNLDIPLDYCPGWVTVTGENECPPDTCHECEHDGEKCCYAPAADGTLNLIDRFHITS